MKNFRTAAVLIPTLLVALTACGSSSTTSGSAPIDSTLDSAVDVATTDSAVDTAPVTTPVATTPPAPPATNPPPTSPPVTTPVNNKPKINSFSVGSALICFPEATDYVYPSTITATWDVSGATSIYLAIGDEDGPFEQNLSATGSIEVPAQYPCLENPEDILPSTYFLVAENASGRTVKQETRTSG